MPVITRIYVRDRFTCVYCGRLTIPTQVLRLISAALPTEFPYHPHWRADSTSWVYWEFSTSIDHIRAVSTGGVFDDPANLATACARCQYLKSNLSLDVLGWQVRATNADWDGFTSQYASLWKAVGEPTPSTHRPWMRAYAAALIDSTTT